MSVDNVIRNRYLHSFRRFERDLFLLLEDRRAARVAAQNGPASDVAGRRAGNRQAKQVLCKSSSERE